MKLTFRITLCDVDHPMVWRCVSVPGHFTFTQFNQVIQIVMGWTNSHLWQFDDRDLEGENPYFGTFAITDYPEEEFEGEETYVSASKTTLLTYFNKVGQKLNYTYDFGDDWNHEIILEGIDPQNVRTAKCLEGFGLCPVEDVGGPGGWERLKEALESDSPEGEEYREWLGLEPGESLDWCYFAKTPVNHQLVAWSRNPEVFFPDD
ncbi:MAG: plasmid pRiA4b ORF-3 family protein [Bacteroidales bacterium]|nr:plasmid pRiA4b ORF-3 family protein [Bacteroidales bacterium]